MVGSGSGCEERAQRLQDAQANVLCTSVHSWKRVAEEEQKLNSFFLVIANSEDAEVNREVALWARSNACLSYAHDQPEVSDFYFPALAKRGSVQIAISTQGGSPALAAQLRRQFSALLENAGEKLDAVVRELETIRSQMPRGEKRMQTLIQLASRVRLKGTLQIAASDEEQA